MIYSSNSGARGDASCCGIIVSEILERKVKSDFNDCLSGALDVANWSGTRCVPLSAEVILTGGRSSKQEGWFTCVCGDDDDILHGSRKSGTGGGPVDLGNFRCDCVNASPRGYGDRNGAKSNLRPKGVAEDGCDGHEAGSVQEFVWGDGN